MKIPAFIFKRKNQLCFLFEIIWWIAIAYYLASLTKQVSGLFEEHLPIDELLKVIKLGAITAFRVLMMLVFSSIIWLPLGILISLRPKLVEKLQSLLQFLTAIPANIYFPIFAISIMHFKLNPEIWLSFMMIIGAQWYILYNVMAGGASIPTELLEAGKNFKLSGFVKWKDLFLPAIFPFYITGLITASGGAWNASVVSELINWGNHKIYATGLGAYIAQNTSAGDFTKISVGVMVMCCYVVFINFAVWKPLHKFASNRFRLE